MRDAYSCCVCGIACSTTVEDRSLDFQAALALSTALKKSKATSVCLCCLSFYDFSPVVDDTNTSGD